MNGEHYTHPMYYPASYPYPLATHNFCPESLLDIAVLEADSFKHPYPYHDSTRTNSMVQLTFNTKKMGEESFTPPQLNFGSDRRPPQQQQQQREAPAQKSKPPSAVQMNRQRRAERSKVSRAIAKEGFHGLWDSIPCLRGLDQKPTNTRILNEAIHYIRELSAELASVKEKLVTSEEKLRASEDALIIFKSYSGRGLLGDFEEEFNRAPNVDYR